jgi:hypothetical protein
LKKQKRPNKEQKKKEVRCILRLAADKIFTRFYCLLVLLKILILKGGLHLFGSGHGLFFFDARFIILFQAHDQILDIVGVGNFFEFEPLRFTGGLDIDIAVIEKSRDDAHDISRDILNLIQFQFAYFPGKKAVLLNVDDPFVGDDPDIKIIVDPNEGKKYQDKHGKGAFKQGKKSGIFRIFRDGEKERKKDMAAKQEDKHQKNQKKTGYDIEPMAMESGDGDLVFSIAGDVSGDESMHISL